MKRKIIWAVVILIILIWVAIASYWLGTPNTKTPTAAPIPEPYPIETPMITPVATISATPIASDSASKPSPTPKPGKKIVIPTDAPIEPTEILRY